jgi:hypothetical protein
MVHAQNGANDFPTQYGAEKKHIELQRKQRSPILNDFPHTVFAAAKPKPATLPYRLWRRQGIFTAHTFLLPRSIPGTAEKEGKEGRAMRQWSVVSGEDEASARRTRCGCTTEEDEKHQSNRDVRKLLLREQTEIAG